MVPFLMFMRCTERSLNAIKTVEADPVMATFPGAGGGGGVVFGRQPE